MGLLQTIHGELRWLVALAAVVVIIKFLIGWLGKRQYTPLDRTLLMIYTILVDINVLLGLILLFVGGFNGQRLEHATTMLLAAISAHMTAIWRNKPIDSAVKYRNQLLLVLLSLALILFGVWRIREGSFF
jgi:hypothetical protein